MNKNIWKRLHLFLWTNRRPSSTYWCPYVWHWYKINKGKVSFHKKRRTSILSLMLCFEIIFFCYLPLSHIFLDSVFCFASKFQGNMFPDQANIQLREKRSKIYLHVLFHRSKKTFQQLIRHNQMISVQETFHHIFLCSKCRNLE